VRVSSAVAAAFSFRTLRFSVSSSLGMLSLQSFLFVYDGRFFFFFASNNTLVFFNWFRISFGYVRHHDLCATSNRICFEQLTDFMINVTLLVRLVDIRVVVRPSISL
jgi:hypothetical protein